MFRIVAKGKLVDAEFHYLKGHYFKAAESKTLVETVCYKIGGFVFTGQHQEARLLFKEFEARLEINSLIIAQFHLGISFTRTSDYQQARGYFCSNLKIIRREKVSSIAKFYTFQGISFYRFFFSQHKKSQKYAETGYAFLLKSKEAPALLLALSLDIQGHNQIQLGRIHLGLSALKKALEITKNKKLLNLNSEINIALVIYESEFDYKINFQLNKLISVLNKTDDSNDYSRSELVLQITKLYLLMGQFLKANSFLAENFDVVYKNENKRKIAKLNTLLAQFLFHKGQFLEALSVAKIAQKNLNKNTDRSLLLPIIGIEIKILKLLNKDNSEPITRAHQLTKSIDRHINERIQARYFKQNLSDNQGEDQLGDLFDQVDKKDELVLNKIIEGQVLGLIPELYQIPPGRESIIINTGKKTIFTITKDEINISKSSLTKIQLDILSHIKDHACSKEELVKRVWGYEYDPLRHDSLVYSSIARLRKTFGEQKSWILSDDQSYQILPGVLLKVISKKIENHGSQFLEKTQDITQMPMNFNYRQIEAIGNLHGKALSVSDYADLWGITRMTALRDLKELCLDGHAKRVGRGRATRYYIFQE